MSIKLPVNLPVSERLVIFERARGYTSSASKVLDETRIFNGVIRVHGSGYGAIARYWADDIAPSRTFKAIATPLGGGTFPTDLIDHDDSTGCQWSVTGVPTDLFTIDFGSSVTGFLRVVASGGGTGTTLIVYGSNDGTTWTQISSVQHGTAKTEIAVFVNGYRYVKIGGVSGPTITIYTVEFYPATSLPTSRSFSNVTSRVFVFAIGYYHVFEVITV